MVPLHKESSVLALGEWQWFLAKNVSEATENREKVNQRWKAFKWTVRRLFDLHMQHKVMSWTDAAFDGFNLTEQHEWFNNFAFKNMALKSVLWSDALEYSAKGRDHPSFI